jgi:hypothetical protein
MHWRLSHRADPVAREIADRHYNRQKIGTPQFVPPGRCLVLVSNDESAFWITSWPFAQYVKHEWAGAWVCSAFRNEGQILSSELIRDAVAASRAEFGDPPSLGMVTFVDMGKVRRKRDWGRCYRKAGFRPLEKRTKGGLFVLQMLPEDMPEPESSLPFVGELFRGISLSVSNYQESALSDRKHGVGSGGRTPYFP